MNPDPAFRAGTVKSALVVDPSASDVLFLVSVLSALGYRVTSAESFEEAKALLTTSPPDLLVTALRLGEYNGLHLVLRGKSERPKMSAVVTSPVADSVLLADAESMSATFVVMPISNDELLAAIVRTAARGAGTTPIMPPFERRQQERRVATSAVIQGSDRRMNADRRRLVPSSDSVQLLR